MTINLCSMLKPTIVSGMQPTGSLHIGNYLGALKNWVNLQNSGAYEMYFFVADLHSLTIPMDPKVRRENIRLLAAEYIAAGLDPKKSTIFVQSYVPEHTELAWVFSSVTPVGELKRMTQFKDKANTPPLEIDHFIKTRIGQLGRTPTDSDFLKELDPFKKSIENNVNTGLLTYPILQAADILLYKATQVPVGQDQVQHLELAHDTVRWFNNKYGEFFKDVKPLLTEVPKVMSLLEPTKKMSKSAGENHYIGIGDEPSVIENKLKKAVTATEGGGTAPGVQNLLMLLKQFGDAGAHQQFVQAEKDGTIRYGDLKKVLGESIAQYFANFRAKRAELLAHPKKLDEILEIGAENAKKVAEKTMEEVREIVGLR